MIRKIDIEAMTIDIDVPDRYPVPEVGKNNFRAPFFGRSFIPDAPGARTGHGDNIYIEEVSRLEGERRLRLHIRENAQNSDNPATSMRPRVRYAAEQGATEFVVPHVNNQFEDFQLFLVPRRPERSPTEGYCVRKQPGERSADRPD